MACRALSKRNEDPAQAPRKENWEGGGVSLANAVLVHPPFGHSPPVLTLPSSSGKPYLGWVGGGVMNWKVAKAVYTVWKHFLLLRAFVFVVSTVFPRLVLEATRFLSAI